MSHIKNNVIFRIFLTVTLFHTIFFLPIFAYKISLPYGDKDPATLWVYRYTPNTNTFDRIPSHNINKELQVITVDVADTTGKFMLYEDAGHYIPDRTGLGWGTDMADSAHYYSWWEGNTRKLSVYYEINTAIRVKVTLYNITGHKALTIHDQDGDAQKGRYRRVVDVTGLAAGVYFLCIDEFDGWEHAWFIIDWGRTQKWKSHGREKLALLPK